MSKLQVWSTEGQGLRRRMEFWNECATNALHSGMTVDAAEPAHFWGRIAKIEVNSVGLAGRP
jgi:hypothetical protein